MRVEAFYRAIRFGIFACAFAEAIFSSHDADVGTADREGAGTGGQRYSSKIPGMMLPKVLLLTGPALCLGLGPVPAARFLLPLIFCIFLQISLYYALLLPILPLLRRRISARTCAMLWLLPTYICLLFYAAKELPAPTWVLYLPGKAMWILSGIWFAGFVAVMVWKIAEHLAFRRSILQGAREVDDPAICRIWNAEIESARIKRPRFKLMVSAHVRTPVSIGLYKRATRVVLPEKDYAPEDLQLILRHEIIHIAREDAWAKFFMVFCTAMCWFNPLMWIAMRKSAEDIELSCDETVLLEANDKMRKQYGLLLLETAADERGFTTCLSATATAMRYRLTNIIKPQKRRSGALIAGILLFGICMTGGYTALAYGSISGAEAIYGGQDFAVCAFQSIEKEEGIEDRAYTAVDPPSLHGYLAGLELAEMDGNYSFEEIGTEFELDIDTPEGQVEVILYDRYARVTKKGERRVYYIPEGNDWALVLQTIEPKLWYKN